MGGREKSTQDGFDELINGQKAQPGTARVTLAQFDTEYEVVYQNLALDEVPALKLIARGGTALNDGIGRLVTSVGEELAALREEERPGLVVVVIMTDGYENSSVEWSAARVKDLVEQQEKQYGWKFIFLGSGIDVQREGVQMRGMKANTSMAFDVNAPVAVAAAYSSTSGLIGSMRSAVAAGASQEVMDSLGYDDEDREAAMGDK
jgi:uncharacterized protein YegL